MGFNSSFEGLIVGKIDVLGKKIEINVKNRV